MVRLHHGLMKFYSELNQMRVGPDGRTRRIISRRLQITFYAPTSQNALLECAHRTVFYFTLSFSVVWHSMTTEATFWSKIICHMSTHVFFMGPWQAMYRRTPL